MNFTTTNSEAATRLLFMQIALHIFLIHQQTNEREINLCKRRGMGGVK